MIFSFGHSEREHIEIEVRAGGFQGEASAWILTSELAEFLSELHPLYQNPRGSAEFATLEGQVALRLVGDGRGHIGLKGEIADRGGDGNRLQSTLQFDQTQLKPSINELEGVTSHFPERVV